MKRDGFRKRACVNLEPRLRGNHVFLELALGVTSAVSKESSSMKAASQPGKGMIQRLNEGIHREDDRGF